MRTKTLLVAAAALAAAVTSSQAQTVYSQNIVGYVNETLSGAGSGFSMVSAPIGATNAADVLMPCLQGGDSILTWTGTGYLTYQYVGNGPTTPGGTGPGNWSNNDPLNPSGPPTLSPGEGFFYQNQQGVNETNTWTGTCILSNNVVLTGSGSGFTLSGSSAPVAGPADGTNTIQLPVQGGDSVLTWTGNGYLTYQYVGNGFNTPGGTGPGNWSNNDPLNPSGPPSISLGQGFFYQNQQGVAETWQQVINVNP
jgi:hypothetical protein